MGGASDMRASLPLQVAVYYNGYYAWAFVVVMLLMFIYKGGRREGAGLSAAAAPNQPRGTRRGKQRAAHPPACSAPLPPLSQV